MIDDSHLDTKYFLNGSVFNCPFCNRRNVEYSIFDRGGFDWTADKKCDFWIVRCSSCRNRSFHLTFFELQDPSYSGKKLNNIIDLDEKFFYSVPTSFFTVDKRVPNIIRELMTEAEGCLKSNFLTGASACARKVIYELAVLEGASGDSYEDRIKSLKIIHKEVEETYFDTLLTIQKITSDKVHENSYDGWESKHLRLILSTIIEVIKEIYVVPALRDEKRQKIIKMSEDILIKPPEK